MQLAPNTKAYEPWKQPPFDLNLDIYLFNLTNPDDYVNGSMKPIVEEMGPYRFIERPEKINITWNSNNSTVTYRKLSNFFFDESGSKGSLSDVVTSINVVALVLK